MKEQILLLKAQGFNYNQIGKQLNLDRRLVRYYVLQKEENQKSKAYRLKNRQNPETILAKKVQQFQGKRRKFNHNQIDKRFSVEELQTRINHTPRCYLTGKLLNLSDSSSYQLDHIIPISLGGTNTLENCALACKNANIAKGNMTKDAFLLLCQDVLKCHMLSVS